MAKVKFGIREIADVTFYAVGTSNPIFVFESLKTSSLETAADTVYAMGGKGNPRLLGWDSNRTATLKIQEALLGMKGLAMVAGASGSLPSVGVVTVKHREVLTAVTTTGITVTTSKVPVNATLKTFKDGDYSTPITGSVAGQVVTYSSGVSVGDILEVFYDFVTVATAETVTFSSTKFPSYYTVSADTVVRNLTTGVDEPVKLIFEKVKLQPGFTINMDASGEPSPFDFVIDVFPDVNGNFYKIVKY